MSDDQTATPTDTDTRTAARTATAIRPAPRAVPGQRPAPASAAPVPVRDDFTFTAPPARRVPAPSTAPRASLGLVWMATATAVAVLSGFFVLIVSGRVFTEGPVVLVLTRTHGIHLGDLFALGAWCLATGGLLASALAGTPLRRR